MNTLQETMAAHISGSIKVKEKLYQECGDAIEDLAEILIQRVLPGKNKVLIFGNGGSAADAQHFAAELIGRYREGSHLPRGTRMALPAIALTTDGSALTAIANDFGYDDVFYRQILGLGNEDDVAIGISTSGRSKSVLEALNDAHELGLYTALLTGMGLDMAPGGYIGGIAKPDCVIAVPSTNTAHIQEAHITILHALCETLELAWQMAGPVPRKPQGERA